MALGEGTGDMLADCATDVSAAAGGKVDLNRVIMGCAMQQGGECL
jgi:hypothetical protein